MEVLIAFCTIIVEECRYKGGKGKCSFWNPGVGFKDRDECTKDKKLIEDYMSKCPFIEKYDIVVIDDEWARVELDIAFD